MKRVFVSGGSGYIALHCIKKLLLRGYYVRTSVRSHQKITLIKTSLNKLNITTKNIDFCILDLLKDDGWDNATKNCDYVIHTASPVIPGKVKSELVVKPAVEGLRRCLKRKKKSCKKVGTKCSPHDGPMDDYCEISEKGRCIIKKTKKKKYKLIN